MNVHQILFSILFAILGFFSILYGIQVWIIASGSRFYLFWILLGFACFLLALGFPLHLWTKIPKIYRRIFLILLGLGVFILAIFEILVISAFSQKEEQHLDYLIVLGAQVRKSGPSQVLRYRLDKAKAYLDKNPETICIVSGGQGHKEPFPEADGMYQYLVQCGIDPSRIIKEDQSKTTIENIQFSKKFIPNGASVGLVSNNFHMFRALQIAKKYGLPQASGISADSTPYYLLNNMIREFFGEVKFLTQLLSESWHS